MSGHYDCPGPHPRLEAGPGLGPVGIRLPAPTMTAPERSSRWKAARVIAQSGIEFDATLVFIRDWSGEEQGWWGRGLHARRGGGRGTRDEPSSKQRHHRQLPGGNGIVDGRPSGSLPGPRGIPSRDWPVHPADLGSLRAGTTRVRLHRPGGPLRQGGDHTAFKPVGLRRGCV